MGLEIGTIAAIVGATAAAGGAAYSIYSAVSAPDANKIAADQRKAQQEALTKQLEADKAKTFDQRVFNAWGIAQANYQADKQAKAAQAQAAEQAKARNKLLIGGAVLAGGITLAVVMRKK